MIQNQQEAHTSTKAQQPIYLSLSTNYSHQWQPINLARHWWEFQGFFNTISW